MTIFRLIETVMISPTWSPLLPPIKYIIRGERRKRAFHGSREFLEFRLSSRSIWQMFTKLTRTFVVCVTIAFLGCKSAPPTSSNSNKALAARLEAAEAMATNGGRDAALASVAKAAADANNAEIAKKALELVHDPHTLFLMGQNTTGQCALTFLRHGNWEAATTIAKLIPDTKQREEVLREIATHK